MADEPTPAAPPTPTPATPPPGPPAAAEETTFTQADVTAIAAREKEQGRRSAEAALAEQLGVSLDEAKEIVAQHNERLEADKSEADKAKGKATTAEQKAKDAEAKAAKAETDADVVLALVADGVPAARAKTVLKLIDVEPGADEEAITAAVAALKVDMPEVFTGQAASTDSGDGKPPAPNSDPKARPPRPTSGEDAYQRGIERAKESAGSAKYAFQTD